MKTILVIDKKDKKQLQPNSIYRQILITGCTHTEREFREWVSRTWKATYEADLGILANWAATGGWAVYIIDEI